MTKQPREQGLFGSIMNIDKNDLTWSKLCAILAEPRCSRTIGYARGSSRLVVAGFSSGVVTMVLRVCKLLFVLSALAACSAPGVGQRGSVVCPLTQGGEGASGEVLGQGEPGVYQATSPAYRTGPIVMGRTEWRT
jgi:hypothetical protein